jgi:hypothetical protein
VNRPNIILGASAAACVIAGGALLAVTEHLPFGSGLCTSLGTATTSGCNTSAPVAAQVVSVGLMLLAIPILGALFGRLTAGHTSRKVHEHVAASEKRLMKHLEERLAEHHKGLAVVSPARRPAKPNGTSERLATRDERAAPDSEPTVTDSRKLRDPKGSTP